MPCKRSNVQPMARSWSLCLACFTAAMALPSAVHGVAVTLVVLRWRAVVTMVRLPVQPRHTAGEIRVAMTANPSTDAPSAEGTEKSSPAFELVLAGGAASTLGYRLPGGCCVGVWGRLATPASASVKTGGEEVELAFSSAPPRMSLLQESFCALPLRKDETHMRKLELDT
jgi:hypothetical protein